MMPSYASPTLSFMKSTLIRSSVSRSASMAARSLSREVDRHPFELLFSVERTLAVPAADNSFEDAVADEVRIPADRRSEVAVEIEGEAEVAQVLRRISCLLHRLQQDAVDQEFMLFLPHVLQYGLEWEPAFGIGFVRNSQGLQQSLEIVQLLALRRLVDTVYDGAFLLRDEAGHGLVCRYHKLFYDALGEETLRPQDVLYPPFHVEDQLRLRQVEIEVPLRLAARFQYLRQLAHPLQLRHQSLQGACRPPYPF